MPQTAIHAFFQLIKLNKEWKKSFAKEAVCIFFLNTLTAALEGTSFTFLLAAFSTFTEKKTVLFIPFLTSQALFPFFFACALGAQLLKSTSQYYGQWWMTKGASRLQQGLQETLLKQIFQLTYSRFNAHRTGQLIDDLMAPPHVIPSFMDALYRTIVSFFIALVLLLFMAWISFSLTLVITGLFIVISLTQKFVIKKVTEASQRHSKAAEQMSIEAVENLYAYKTVVLFNQEEKVFNRLQTTLKQITDETKSMHQWLHALIPFQEVLGIILVAGAYGCAWFLYPPSHATAPYLLTFLLLTYRLATRLQILVSALGTMQSWSGSLQKIVTFISSQPQERRRVPHIPFRFFEKEIRFENVTLTYSNSSREALKNVSLTIPKGALIAWAGRSGAGKTSLLDLLSCLYEPTQGKIVIDGTDILSYDPATIREHIGVVSQEPLLFHASIRENILFGSPYTAPQDLQEVMEQAGIISLLNKLPQGLDTMIGERGFRLSGGEKQRIALARALIRRPSLLLLDEATSNLDSESEHHIQNALRTLRGKMTIVLIAHRLNSLVEADLIYVFDEGHLVEQGSHHDLLALGGRYRLFWGLQQPT